MGEAGSPNQFPDWPPKSPPKFDLSSAALPGDDGTLRIVVNSSWLGLKTGSPLGCNARMRFETRRLEMVVISQSIP